MFSSIKINIYGIETHWHMFIECLGVNSYRSGVNWLLESYPYFLITVCVAFELFALINILP